MMEGHLSNIENLISLWRSNVADAKIRYDFARTLVKEARQAHSPTLEEALRAENAAQAYYLRVLRLCNELVLHGTVPEEERPSGLPQSSPAALCSLGIFPCTTKSLKVRRTHRYSSSAMFSSRSARWKA